MGATGSIAHWVSLILIFLGGGLLLVYTILGLRTPWRKSGVLTSLGLFLSTVRRGQYHQLRNPDAVAADQVPELRTTAKALVKNRLELLLSLGMSLLQIGIAIPNGPLWGGLVACMVVVLAGASVLTERQARVGEAFLRRYPAPPVPVV
jgi:hypothetical protein